MYIEDTWSADIFIQPVVDEKLASDTVKALEKFSLDEIYDCASEIVDRLMHCDDYMNDVETIEAYDENTFEHSLHVAINAVTLGIGLGYNFYRLKNLAVGAMLHDIGKQLVPLEIITKNGRLTESELSVVRMHPEFGYNILAKDINTYSSTRAIVYQHHENWDGTGYPRGLKGNEIYELAMVTHICDVYDALISKRSYKEAFSFQKTISIIKDGLDTMYNPSILEAFFQYVPIYHKGTEIKLSNGDNALVFRNNRGDMLKPVVKLKNSTLIDLRTSKLEIIS